MFVLTGLYFDSTVIPRLEYNVTEVHIHPGYDHVKDTNVFFLYDIALIKLNQTINPVTNGMLSDENNICLPQMDDKVEVGMDEYALQAGWGTKAFNSTLQVAYSRLTAVGNGTEPLVLLRKLNGQVTCKVLNISIQY